MSPIAQLRNPRRAAVALALFVAFGGMGTGIVGYALAASASESQSAASFELAPPHAGDRGTFVLAATEGHSIAQASWEAPTGGFSFAWLEDERVHDGGATEQWANVLYLNDTVAAGETASDHHARLMAFAPGTDVPLAIFSLEPRQGEDGANGASHGTQPVSSQRQYVSQEFQKGPATLSSMPCGIVSPLRAGVHREGEEVPMSSECTPNCCATEGFRLLKLDKVWSENGTTFARAHDFERSAGKDTALLQYWFRSDTPYPVRIEADGGAWSLRLDSLTRGQGVVRSHAEVLHASGAPPSLQLASWQGNVPDEAGILHPFPLSEAYRRAKANSTPLQGFLRDHPRSYVAQADYSTMEAADEGQSWYSWSFTVTDGHQAQGFSVRAVEQDRGPLIGGPLAKQRSYDYHVEAAEDAEGKYPTIERLPTSVPTVASLWKAWESYASPEYHGKSPNLWGFLIRCPHTCNQLEAHFSGGYALYNRTTPYAVPPLRLVPSSPLDVSVSSILAWSGTSTGAQADPVLRPSRYDEERIAWFREGQEPAAPFQGFSTAPESSTRVPLWVFPNVPQAAAVGLGALVASLLYWLWPTLKAGPAALFSRLRSASLLEHPLRAEIHQRIEAEPGIHHQALARAVGRGKGAVEHHLRKLTEAGLVRQVQGKGFTCYFVGRPDAAAIAAAAVLKSPVARGILEMVQRKPGIRPADLARELSVAPATIHYHVERLQGAGLLSGQMDHGALRLHPSHSPVLQPA